MAEHMQKSKLLAEIRSGYAALEAILAPLSPQQMTTPGVNGQWSVKDNLAHISAWSRRLSMRLQAVREGTQAPPGPYAGMTEDEANEFIYQQNKDRSLDDVLADLRATSQQALEAVQQTSEEDLNKPMSWLNGAPLWISIAGNTYEHYQEHSQIIDNWLAR
jgi:hypothetical protein